MRPCPPSRTPPSLFLRRLCVSFISGCDSNLRRCINVLSGTLCAIESAVGHRRAVRGRNASDKRIQREDAFVKKFLR